MATSGKDKIKGEIIFQTFFCSLALHLYVNFIENQYWCNHDRNFEYKYQIYKTSYWKSKVYTLKN